MSQPLDVVFTISITDPINVKLTASRSKIFVDQDTKLSAGEAMTSVPGFTNRKGLIFKWGCPAAFKSWCTDFYGSPSMDLPYKSFVKYGTQVDQDLTFTVYVRNVLSDP